MRSRVAAAASAACALVLAGAQAGAASAQVQPDLVSIERPDVAVVWFAKERGISIEESARRIAWMSKVGDLEPRLQIEMGHKFGGLWVNPDNGDRLVLGVVRGTPADNINDARQVLREADVLTVTDEVEVDRSSLRLEADLERLRQQLPELNTGGTSLVGLQMNRSRNRVELIIPDDGPLNARQQRFVDENRKAGNAVAVRGRTKLVEESCNASRTTPLHCNAPARGGTHFSTSFNRNCTLGFTARSRVDSKRFFVTAGHCFPEDRTTVAYGQFANERTQTYGLLHRANTPAEGADEALVNIDADSGWSPAARLVVLDREDTVQDLGYYIAGDGAVSHLLPVCTTGGHSRDTTCGRIIADLWIHPSTGDRLARTDQCRTTGGDSGGPVYRNHTAYAIHLGSLGPCEKFINPIRSVENALNVDILTI